MKEVIPAIKFSPSRDNTLGLDIVSIDKIFAHKDKYKHNPELPHQLKFYNLIFFTEGEGQHLIDFKWYNVKKNTLVYLSKEQVNAFRFTEGLKGYCVIFTEEYFVNSFAHLPKDIVFRLFNPQLFLSTVQIPIEAGFSEYFSLLRKEFNIKNSFNQKTILQSLFTVLLSKAEDVMQSQTFHVKDSNKIRLFQKFTSLLEEKFTDSRSADYYSNELAISYKHLNVLCRELVGKTAKHVIDEFVTLQAKRSLISSGISSVQLAYKMGFDDPTNFTKYFKKNTGLTPNQFKKIDY